VNVVPGAGIAVSRESEERARDRIQRTTEAGRIGSGEIFTRKSDAAIQTEIGETGGETPWE